MSIFTKTITASLGPGKTGLVGTLGFTVFSATGTLIPRTTAGISEASGGQGDYFISINTWDSSWAGRISWDSPAGVELAQESFDSKDGVILDPTGLDSISTTAPSGVASNFRQMMVQVWRRFFKRVYKDASNNTIKTYADDGTTVVTSQAYSTSSTFDTTDNVGAAS